MKDRLLRKYSLQEKTRIQKSIIKLYISTNIYEKYNWITLYMKYVYNIKIFKYII